MSPETFITTAIMVLVSIVGSVENLLVILAIMYNRRLRTILNYFLFDLAVCDLLTASLAIPLRFVEGFQSGSIPCSVVRIAVTVPFDGLSGIDIIFISIDRFIAVKFPFAYNMYITQITAAVSIASGWVIMAVFAILPVLGVGSAPTEILRNNQGLCFFSMNRSQNISAVFFFNRFLFTSIDFSYSRQLLSPQGPQANESHSRTTHKRRISKNLRSNNSSW